MGTRRSLRLHVTALAEKDLAEIWAYIADDSPKAATAFVAQIEAKFEPLLRHPGIGTRRDQLAPGLRCVMFRNYCIYYVFDASKVTIVRVVHGARDARAPF